MTILVLKPMVTWEPHILPLKNRTLPARADFLASNETTNHGRFEQKKHAAIVDIGAKVLNYTYKLVFWNYSYKLFFEFHSYKLFFWLIYPPVN